MHSHLGPITPTSLPDLMEPESTDNITLSLTTAVMLLHEIVEKVEIDDEINKNGARILRHDMRIRISFSFLQLILN